MVGIQFSLWCRRTAFRPLANSAFSAPPIFPSIGFSQWVIQWDIIGFSRGFSVDSGAKFAVFNVLFIIQYMDLTKRDSKESKVALITGGNALVALVLCSVGIANCFFRGYLESGRWALVPYPWPYPMSSEPMSQWVRLRFRVCLKPDGTDGTDGTDGPDKYR